jgi:hypothetical protein
MHMRHATWIGGWALVATTLLGLLGSGCRVEYGDDDGSVTQTVGPAGGTLQFRDMTLEIPKGALESNRELTISESSAELPEPYRADSTVYRFEPEGLQFQMAARVRFSATSNNSERPPTVYWSTRNDSGSESSDSKIFRPLVTTSEDGQVVADVDHFSRGFAGTLRQCSTDADCRGNTSCNDGYCYKPACSNGAHDGLETDTDCGGPQCGKCELGDACRTGSDCFTGRCVGGTCRVPSADVGVDAGPDAGPDTGPADVGDGGMPTEDADTEDADVRDGGPSDADGVSMEDALADVPPDTRDVAPDVRDAVADAMDADADAMDVDADAMDADADTTDTDADAMDADVSDVPGDIPDTTDTDADAMDADVFDVPGDIPDTTDADADTMDADVADTTDADVGRDVIGGTRTLTTRLLGSSGDDRATDVAVAPNGDIYVVGTTSGSLGGQTHTRYDDAFLAKYDKSGNRQWVRLLGGSNNDVALSVALDGTRAVYIGGWTFSSTLGGKTKNGSTDAFMARYDTSGNRKWVRLYGTSEYEQITSISTRGSTPRVTGFSTGNIFGKTNRGRTGLFVAELGSGGSVQWSYLTATSGFGKAKSGRDLAVGNNGEVYVAGAREGQVTAGSFVGGNMTFEKLDSTGSRLWRSNRQSPPYERAEGVAIDGSGIYVVGRHYTVNNGNDSAYLIRYDASGTRQWTSLAGDATGPAGNNGDPPSSIAVDHSGGVYVAGHSNNDFEGQTNAGKNDFYFAKFDTSGTLQWSELVGTPEEDEAHAIAAPRAGKLIVVGETRGDLGRNSNSGGADAFLTIVR